jgi:hypothetical protein
LLFRIRVLQQSSARWEVRPAYLGGKETEQWGAEILRPERDSLAGPFGDAAI